MVKIDLKRLNLNSPYTIVKGTKRGNLLFETDFGVQYDLFFMYDDTLLSDEAYQLVITNVNNKKSPRDIKLRATIVAIISEFFESNNSTMLYICDTSDNKQSFRNRLFESWFNAFVNKDCFLFYSAEVEDAEGVYNYAAVIVRKDNPKAEQIIAEFENTVQLLSVKP